MVVIRSVIAVIETVMFVNPNATYVPGMTVTDVFDGVVRAGPTNVAVKLVCSGVASVGEVPV